MLIRADSFRPTNKRKFRITGTRGEHLWVEAFDRREAVEIARQHGIVAQHISDSRNEMRPKSLRLDI